MLMALWPISSFLYVTKWDNIDCYLPYRYFISSYVWQGEWPFWNPFQYLGYPAYSDMQNGMYSPVVWFLMLFGKYNITSLIVEVIFYYIIAVFGAYKVSGLFMESKKAKMLVALAFGFSGFMMSTSQIMIFIAGGAFFPHILYHFIKFFKENSFKHAGYFVMFTALNITLASPAYSIVLVYILGFVLVYYSYQKVKYKAESGVKFTWGRFALICTLLIAVTLPYINSVLEFLPYFRRASKLPYSSYLISGSFDYQEYISFLFPYVTLSSSTWFGPTDVTLRSGYFGIIPLIFSFYALKNWKQKNVKLLFFSALIFFVLAAGGTTPIYRLFYELPGFGLFRHPSFFRSYALLFTSILAGIGFEFFEKSGKTNEIKFGILAVLVISVISLIVAFINVDTANLLRYLSDWNINEHPVHDDFFTYLIVNVLIVILLLVLGFIKVLKGKKVAFWLLVITILDLFTYSQLTSRHTLFARMKHQDYVNYFDQLPDTINQQVAQVPYKELHENYDPKTEGIWRNTATYYRSLAYDAHNQTQFINFNVIEDNGGFEITKENPLFYDINKQIALTDSSAKEPNVLWQHHYDYQFILNPKELEINKPKVGFNTFEVEVISSSLRPDLLVLNQNYHHNWSAYLGDEKNGTELKIHNVNNALMAVEIPAGYQGKIYYKFNSPRTKWFLLISVFSYGLVLLLIYKKD